MERAIVLLGDNQYAAPMFVRLLRQIAWTHGEELDLLIHLGILHTPLFLCVYIIMFFLFLLLWGVLYAECMGMQHTLFSCVHYYVTILLFDFVFLVIA